MAQGVRLGGLNAKGIAKRQDALEWAEQLRPVFAEMGGHVPPRHRRKTQRTRFAMPAGGKWHAVTVKRVL